MKPAQKTHRIIMPGDHYIKNMPEILEEKIEEPIEPVEAKVTAQKIIIGLVTTAIIVGGVIVGFDAKTTPKMSYEEAQKLIEVYDHELKKAPDKNLNNVNNENMVSKLNDKFSKRVVTVEEDLKGEKINPNDYLILRSGLMQKTK